MAYANDLLVLLSEPAEWAPLLENLQAYSRSSNAKVNLRKTEVFPLAGNPQDEWHVLIKEANGKWHDSTSTESLTYLGYPVWHNQQQLDRFLQHLYVKMERHCLMLSGQNLSVVGRALVANSLLSAKLWHILRVVVAPIRWLKRFTQLIRNYVCPYGYKPS